MSNIKKSPAGKPGSGKSITTRRVQNSVSTTTSLPPIKVRPPKTTGSSGSKNK